MPHSVLRRYTPPTCTLEIMANHSPLSRWAGQPVLKQIRFQLSLDDPKLPSEQWVTLKGDRHQLEALSETVTTYVQRLLQTHSPGASTGVPIAVLPTPAAAALQTTPSGMGIDLQPQGLLTHELVLGSLATEKSGPTVTLSTLQLFDLANALEEYAVDVVSLPTLQRSNWLKSSPWGQVAAIALVMVGLSASMVKLLDSRQTTPTAATNSQGASSSDQRIATLPPTATESPVSNQTLPPPPPLGSTVPASPGLPTVTLPQSPSSASSQSSGTIVAKPVPTRPNQTTISQAPIGNTRLKQAGQPTVQPNVVASAPIANESLTAAQRSAAPTNDRAETDTPFDTIPQIAEARRYFEQRWTPQGLTQTVEYRLTVGSDGTIQQIEPLGQVARDYVDRTGIPLMGEPFISALENGRSAKIRLVLSPDGKVQTFLEGQ